MKVTPILMQPDMVRATLREIERPGEGKSQTRRVVKSQPDGAWAAPGKTDCPYGKPGDLLYVRETWKPDTDNDVSTIRYRADGAHVPIKNTREAADQWVSLRRREEQWPDLKPPKWRPGIHMPRWTSRITLKLTDVRIERVQDISYSNILREGLWQFRTDELQTDARHKSEARQEFSDLWNRINAARGYGWDRNPWVWALTFEPYLTNVDNFIKGEVV